MKKLVTLGLEKLIAHPVDAFKGKRLGLLSNPASVDQNYNHASTLIYNTYPNQLKVLFSPQHGFYAEKQDNMIESDHFMESELHIPVYSLYNETRIPADDMLDQIDILLIDIQDVGTRVYTFIYTISYCLEAAARLNKQVVILDRPNPVGGLQVEGNMLNRKWASFVGRFPIPMRHGLTVGEISQFFNAQFHIGCDLKVIPMTGWQRRMYWQDTGLNWVAPSPNLPTPESCMVYPGQVIFEGTNISEGRGTTLAFEQFGAPFLNTGIIKKAADKFIEGAILRPVNFEPTSGKWCGKVCKGFQIHITAKETFNAYLTSLLLLQLIIKYHAGDFEFKKPPYEYEYKKKPIDLILGSKTLREKIVNLQNLKAVSREWENDIADFHTLSRTYHLYE